MKIAQISPLMEAVPPKLYGGTERIVAYLCDEMVALGHDVTLFASGDSMTKAKLHAAWPKALRLDEGMRDYLAPHILMLEQLARRSDDFDVVHLHVDYMGFGLLRRLDLPYVTTLHGRLDLPELQPLFRPLRRRTRRLDLGFPARAAAAGELYRHRPSRPARAAVAAGLRGRRLSRLPRPDLAGKGARMRRSGIAAAAGMKLKIAAKVDKVDQAYFAQQIEPLLSQPHVEFLGEIGEDRKAEFLGNAAGLLFPIAWREPFGLVMIEAMACGTPVIAFPSGSVPEVIEEGVTGFMVESEEQAAAAARRLHGLDRARIRRQFEERFTARRMAEDYLKLYRGLIARHRPLQEAV